VSDSAIFFVQLWPAAGPGLAPACSGPAFFLTPLKSALMVTGKDTLGVMTHRKITYRR